MARVVAQVVVGVEARVGGRAIRFLLSVLSVLSIVQAFRAWAV